MDPGRKRRGICRKQIWICPPEYVLFVTGGKDRGLKPDVTVLKDNFQFLDFPAMQAPRG
jgi:hypothetical protein